MATEKCTLIPEQLFESQDAFIAHVKRYSVENGFNVRLDDVERDKSGVIRKRDIVCSSEGAPRGKDAKREDSAGRVSDNDEPATPTAKSVAHSGAHRRKSMKTGCRWLARASRQHSGMWKIIMLRLEHNHPLAARYDLLAPLAHSVRTGDHSSISAAALAARSAVENGSYAGPSAEFKDLFLQMMAACTDLCWSAARHPETIAEVLSEIRRLNQHLEKHGEAAEPAPARAPLPAIAEDPGHVASTSAALAAADGALVMMGHGAQHVAAGSPPQPAHLLAGAAAETPAQIIAQGRAVETHSPELNGGGLQAAQAAAASPALPAASAAGPVKRSRGRPRKNPLGADGKAARAKAPARRDAQKAQRAQPQTSQMPIAPTPASLASLSQQIISQNAASPVSAQRPVSSSLALPSQPMQGHVQHAASRAQIIATDAAAPSLLDARSQLNPVQRQQQPPQPQPQQSPTFFLGAAEGNGYSERAAAPEHAAVGDSGSAAAAPVPYADAPEDLGRAAPGAAQKPAAPAAATAAAAAGRAAAAAASVANVPRYSAAAGHAVRYNVLAPAADPGLSPAAAAVPRAAAAAAVSVPDPAANAAAAVDVPHYRSPLPSSYSQQQLAMESPQLSVAGYHHQPHSAGYHYHHQQQQQQYSNQLSRMQPASAPVTDSVASQQQQQQQQRAMFHLNPAVHTTQISRDSAAPLNSYLLMPRMQQQQQQQKQQQYQQHQAAAAAAADRLVNMQQSPTNSISALPSVPHSTVLSEHSRRFEELNIGSYQGMGGWQM